MGVKTSKRYSFYSFDSIHTKLASGNLDRLKFNIVPNGKMQNCQYLGNDQP